MVCDSTNVFVEGEAGSEATIRVNLEKLVKTRRCRVAVTCFASNLARVESIAKAAVAAGRHPVLSGRALQRMVEAAQECGYLLDFPPTVSEQEAGYLPREKVLFICTGSQGEPRASMAKLAAGEHRDLVLEEGDTAIFSSRVIPGNDRAVGRLHNALMARGVEIIADGPQEHIHVSGHPARDELIRMYQWVRPEDRPAGARRDAPPDRACGARQAVPGPGGRRGAQRHAGAAGARAGDDHRHVPAAGWRATAMA
jgi:ribonuclease J